MTRFIVSTRLSRKRAAFAEQLPDNIDVLAGALRAGHSLVGALNVMVDGAAEPSKGEFRRVMQDEQLGVPIDEAVMVMAGRRTAAPSVGRRPRSQPSWTAWPVMVWRRFSSAAAAIGRQRTRS